MRRLLITGGTGFIGTNFVRYWIRQHGGDFVFVLDALTYAANRENLEPVAMHPNFKFVRGNILDRGLVTTLVTEHRLDIIVHFAAESHVDRSIVAPDAFVETNIVGTHNLLKTAYTAWSKRVNGFAGCRFHHVSTDEVYGSLGPTDPGFTESAPYAPNSPYAASKAAADHLVRAYHNTYRLPVTISNCSNNYGPNQFPEKLIPLVLINALNGKKLPLYGDGKNVRDWLYVEDHCRALELVLERGRVGETYNIGGGNERSNIEIVTQICRLIDKFFAEDERLRERFPNCPAAHGKKNTTLIDFVTDRPGHDRRYAINTDRVRRELGYVPAETLDSGLLKTITWYLENEPWWRGLMQDDYRDWISRQYGVE
jgi:dTDP-glucose 4,6-dehydratase